MSPMPCSMATKVTVVCGQFVPAAGGGHPWCETCGWRWDFHPDEVARRPPAALARVRGTAR